MLLQLLEPGVTSIQIDQNIPAIGIDLGTTHTLMAHSQNGKAEILLLDHDHLLIPSVIAGEHVGRPALSQEDAIKSFKRLMHAPSTPLACGKTPIELSAQLLRFLRERAEDILQKPVTKAVITVPAYFDDTARQATKDAATLAGIATLRLLNEPTAAALAYGLDKKVQGTFVVYDLGGGTFDISVLRLHESVFQVLATAGDTQLGGDDIDDAIVDFWQIERTMENLMYARQAKEALSLQRDVCVNGYVLSQEDLERLSHPFVTRTLQLMERVLEDANLSIHEIDDVILVGGSTRLQNVKSAIEHYFKKAPKCDLHPDHIVAIGAALQAENLLYGLDALLLDVCPLSLGIETMGGLVEKIIMRNSPIPIAMAQDFTTHVDGQTALRIHVVQGEREFVDDCRSLAQFDLKGIPPMSAGAARIRVTFTLDVDGILSVSAQERTTGAHQSVHVQPRGGLETEALKRMLNESMEHGRQDMERRLEAQVRQEAEQMLHFVQHALDQDSSLLNVEERAVIDAAFAQLERALLTQQRDEIKKISQELSHITQNFAERRIEKAIYQKLSGNV